MKPILQNRKRQHYCQGSQVPHTDKGEAYCCDVGKGLRSPTEAKQAYDAKAAPNPKKMNIEETGIKPDGSKGPKNWIKCELADDIEDNLREMLKDASADGAELNATIGLRSLEGQWRVWHKAGHPASHAFVASPGTSNHGTGRAIDFHAGFRGCLPMRDATVCEPDHGTLALRPCQHARHHRASSKNDQQFNQAQEAYGGKGQGAHCR